MNQPTRLPLSPPQPQRSGHRGWRWLALLALALALGRPTRLTPAEAAPASAGSVTVWLAAQVVGPPRTICVGDSVTIRATVYKRMEVEGRGVVTGSLLRVRVGATATGGAGSVSPATSATRLANDGFASTSFVFHAEKAGAATIAFRATVGQLVILGARLTTENLVTVVALTVVDCEYRVTATSTWRVPGEAQITLAAKITFAGLRADDEGGYVGTARVRWLASAGQVGDCSGALVPDSTAEITAQKLGAAFVMDIVYATGTVTLDVDCKETGGTRAVPVTPDALHVSVPTSGAVRPLPHVLRGPAVMPGRAVISVVKEGAP